MKVLQKLIKSLTDSSRSIFLANVGSSYSTNDLLEIERDKTKKYKLISIAATVFGCCGVLAFVNCAKSDHSKFKEIRRAALEAVPIEHSAPVLAGKPATKRAT